MRKLREASKENIKKMAVKIGSGERETKKLAVVRKHVAKWE
jgi:DNA-nicking Smr family endonuclease